MARPGSFCPITATIAMVAAVVEAAVTVASVVGAVVVAARWAMSARIFVVAHLGFLSVDVLVGSSDHLAIICGRLAVEFGAKLAMVESSDESGDDLSFCDVGNRIPHLGKVLNVAAEGLDGFWLMRLRSCLVPG